MGAPSGVQGAGRYINASAPTLNYNAPQGFDPSLVVDTLPGSYVRNKTRVGNYRDPNARIEAARQNSPYDTLEKMTRPDGGIYYQGTRQVVNPQQPIMPNIPVAQNNLNFAAPTNTVRQYAPLTVPQQLKTETTREVLPMSYVPS